MVNKENYLLVTIWLFLILVIGFGAFMGSGLTGSNINFPPAGTAYAETTEALAKVQWLKLLRLRDAAVNAVQWTYQDITSTAVAFPEISIPYQVWGVKITALLSVIGRFLIGDFLAKYVAMLVVAVVGIVILLPVFYLIGWLAEPSTKRPNYATRRQRAYVGNVIEIR